MVGSWPITEAEASPNLVEMMFLVENCPFSALFFISLTSSLASDFAIFGACEWSVCFRISPTNRVNKQIVFY